MFWVFLVFLVYLVHRAGRSPFPPPRKKRDLAFFVLLNLAFLVFLVFGVILGIFAWCFWYFWSRRVIGGHGCGAEGRVRTAAARPTAKQWAWWRRGGERRGGKQAGSAAVNGKRVTMEGWGGTAAQCGGAGAHGRGSACGAAEHRWRGPLG